MRHAIAQRKLGRSPGHRKALLRNMMNAMVRSERIETTVAKAKEVRRLAERLITLGKKDTTPARRRVFSMLSDKKNTAKIFATLASRFAGREGGYTRILRTGYRVGDGAEMAILEYLPTEEKTAKTKKGKKKKKAEKEKEKPAAKTTKAAKPARTSKKSTGKKPSSAREKKGGTEGEKGKPAKKGQKAKKSS
ncbi:MAG: 50S ribosomal protein L17 [Deltaproteobacteria bacterium]|nr:MAG: 50S ribosomal protein L17 [Deltaproteobacteria bacterium]